MQENKKQELSAEEYKYTIGMTEEALDDVLMALNEIVDNYDSGFELNLKDALDFCHGNFKNNVGEKSWEFLTEHKRILWLVRTAMTYCQQAQDKCRKVA